jgi:hypothetical protein
VRARYLALFLICLLAGWSLGVGLWLGREWTASVIVQRWAYQQPIVGYTAGAVSVRLLQTVAADLREFDFWIVAVAFVVAGHIFWPV